MLLTKQEIQTLADFAFQEDLFLSEFAPAHIGPIFEVLEMELSNREAEEGGDPSSPFNGH